MQPVSQTIVEGKPVTFTIDAIGTNLHYQWRNGNEPIPNATSATFTIAVALVTDSNAVFSCIVSNSVDTVISNGAVLTVVQSFVAPEIRVQPTSKTVTAGKSALFSVIASGTALHYQWYKDTAFIQNALSSEYTIPVTTLADSGKSFKCMVYNSVDTVMSSDAKLTITKNVIVPTITVQPQNETVAEGQSVTFIVNATGSDLNYQWQKGNVDITGANGSTYSVLPVASADNTASYRCVVSNTTGTVISNAATLTVVYAVTYLGNGNSTGSVPVDTGIYLQNGIIIVKDNTGSLTRTGHTFGGWNRTQNGTGKVYQHNDTLLAGTEHLQLYVKWSIDSFTVSFNSNEGSSVTAQMIAYGGYATEPAVPTKTGFAFEGWYSNQALTALFDFTTPITATRTLFAKWNPVYRVIYNVNGGSGSAPVDNNLYQSGQLVSVLDKPTVLTRQYYDFAGWNTASNGTGATRLVGTSFQIGTKNDTLYANWQIAKPAITLQPLAVSVFPLDNISMSATAEGIGLTYQWQKDGVNLTGATNSVYAKQKVNFSDSGYYCCVVGNVSGNTPSSTVKLTLRTTVKDADSNVYSIVAIGDQVWMAENLKTTRYRDGSPILEIKGGQEWADLTTPAYCWYTNDSSLFKKDYGALYNWHVIDPVNTKQIAPEGWHVPSDSEWVLLASYLGGSNVAGGSLKEEGFLHWTYPNEGATNSSGFKALPGGYCSYNGTFGKYGAYGVWWTTTENDQSTAIYHNLYSDRVDMYRKYNYYNKNYGFSIRCIRDK